MKTENTFLLSLFFCSVVLPLAGFAGDIVDIDQERVNVSGDGYVIGVSNDGEDMVLLRIMDTGNISDAEVRHRAYVDATWLAKELELQDFLVVYDGNENLFQERLERKLNDLMLLEKIGMENGEIAPSLVRFFTEET